MPEPMSAERAEALLDEIFAPWIRALGLRVLAIEPPRARLLLPANPALSRGGGDGGGVVCGQALASAADTASVVTLAALNGVLRPCTTVDLTAHFLRPVPEGDVEITVEALSNGRRMATSRAEFRTQTGKLGATVTCAFAYLDL